MLTAVTQSSRDAFHELKADGKQKEQILSKFTRGVKLTRRQIASMCGMETSTVSARINALLKDGRLMKSGVMTCPLSNKTVEGIKLAETQLELI